VLGADTGGAVGHMLAGYILAAALLYTLANPVTAKADNPPRLELAAPFAFPRIANIFR